MSVAWGKNDFANNSPKFAVNQVRKQIDTANVTELFSNTTSGVYGNYAAGQFGVSVGEMAAVREAAAARPAHAGWVLRKEGTGGRAGRVHIETLVAMKSITNDNEDTIFADYVIVIDTQPSNSSANTNDPINLVVSARTVPTGGTLAYAWQRAQANGVWLAVSSAGIFSGANTNNLAISNNATLHNNVFRVLITSAGAANVYSTNATVTIV